MTNIVLILPFINSTKKNKKAYNGKEDGLKLIKKDSLSHTYPRKHIFMYTFVYILWKYHEEKRWAKE